jgi:hypothetical protein
MGPLDKVIAGFVERPPAVPVRMILRLGAAELLVAGGDAHGVVNAAVALAKSGGPKTARSSGLVNAVLRRIAEGGARTGPNMSRSGCRAGSRAPSANPWASRRSAPSRPRTRRARRSTSRRATRT